MSPTARRWIGIGGMTLMVLVYIAVAMVVGAVYFADAGPAAQLAYFAVAGLAWTLPAAVIIKWMRRA